MIELLPSWDPVSLTEGVAYELALFAGIGYLIIGLDEIAVDLIWIISAIRGFGTRVGDTSGLSVDGLMRPDGSVWLAVLVPAKEEHAVLGGMLSNALNAYSDAQVHIFVGCYPDDSETIRVARQFEGSKLTVIINGVFGRSTKAENLNEIYAATAEYEYRHQRRFAGYVIHDAEDVVHRYEFAVFDAYVQHYGLIQLPVIPLPRTDSRWVSGHYCDEFAEAHCKTLIVRGAVGAALPSAGVGCMIRRDAIEALAAARNGRPFADNSYTEDYELGLRTTALGFKSAFLRITAPGRFRVVGTTAFFPSDISKSVAQKGRWVAGISLAAWDGLGWARGWIENWMRLRDRMSLLAAGISVAGYCAAMLGCLLQIGRYLGLIRLPVLDPSIAMLICLTGTILVWRLAFRFCFVRHLYGLREGLRSIPRIAVSSVIGILSARFGVFLYLEGRRTGEVRWDKTAHQFPSTMIDA